MLLFSEITPKHPPHRQYTKKVSLFFFYFTKFFILKKSFSVIGWHSEAAIGQQADGVAGPGLDVRRAGSRREKQVTRLQPRAVDLLVSAE